MYEKDTPSHRGIELPGVLGLPLGPVAGLTTSHSSQYRTRESYLQRERKGNELFPLTRYASVIDCISRIEDEISSLPSKEGEEILWTSYKLSLLSTRGGIVHQIQGSRECRERGPDRVMDGTKRETKTTEGKRKGNSGHLACAVSRKSKQKMGHERQPRDVWAF
jgi:hypothetical protein